MNKLGYIVFACVFAILCGCAGGDVGKFTERAYEPAYASGFGILRAPDGESMLIETRSPWQGADSSAVTRLLVLAEGEDAPAGFDGQVLAAPARRVVCMSSSHVAMLDALGAVDRIVGVSGIGFITNEYIRAHADSVADVGYDGNIDYEALVGARPDLVLLYGVAGASTLEPKLRELGIPFAYVGEYLEDSPVGKAEWIVPVGEMTGLGREAREYFAGVPERYDKIKKIAAEADDAPAVMINTPYADQWVMASADSYVARLIADAGGRYVYAGHPGNRSLPVDMEEALRMASEADVWINTGIYDTLDGLRSAVPNLTETPPLRNGNVWNSSLRATAGGGNDYWESGVVNPYAVLDDLVNIYHPGLVPDSAMIYYRRLR